MHDALTITIREYFSLTHIQSAAHMARIAWAVEEQFQGQYNQMLNHQGKAYSLAAIYSATSFLEATVNELFHDADDRPNGPRFQGQPPNRISDLARYVNARPAWNTFKNAKNNAYRLAGTYGNEILNKFQFAATSLGHAELVETSFLFISTKLLIDTRNKLTHYEPETVAVHDSEGPVTIQQITQRLNGLFENNPFSVAGNHNHFPSLQLGHGAAEWSVETAIAFADHFYEHIGLPKPYEHIRINCSTQ